MQQIQQYDITWSDGMLRAIVGYLF